MKSFLHVDESVGGSEMEVLPKYLSTLQNNVAHAPLMEPPHLASITPLYQEH